MPIRLLIADDHPIVRDGLRAVLDTQPDFDIVAEAGSKDELLQQAQASNPDIVLLDLEMPGGDGVLALRELRRLGNTARVIIFTAYDTDERIIAALRAGAQGYLLKGAPREELFRAIRVVSEGGSLLQPVVMSRLLRQVDEPELVESLTPRETEVLQQLARGLQNKEIALELNISERTVKFHVSRILAKLDAGNRTEAVTIAAQHNLIQL